LIEAASMPVNVVGECPRVVKLACTLADEVVT
jgi:hypothetical protein